MRIALIGAAGQLGADLQTILPGDVIPLTHETMDVTQAANVQSTLDGIRPDFVVNAAAYTLVDKAEDEPETAFAVNALGPRNLAAWCGRAGVVLVHFSTDYVFSGTRSDTATQRPFREEDIPDPQSVYAVTKLAGEHFVRAECPKHFILRTCGLYGRHFNATKGNFVETMLRLGRERLQAGKPLTVVDDHICTPTSTIDLASATARLVMTTAWGLYHATNSGQTTWRQFAEEIFRLAGMPVTVVPISSSQRPTKARRPNFSALDCSRLASTIGGPLLPWEEALARYLQR